MNFLWPWFLSALLLVPAIITLYVWMLRRRRKYAISYSSLSLIREAIPRRARWRRHLPFALFMIGLTGVIGAAARPAADVEIPLSRTTIILAIDVSRSMCATDVAPNRLTVAQDAALSFIDGQADGTQIGIVAFAGFAETIVSPTHDKNLLREAITNLTTSLGTAIGSATLKSIDAISEINPAIAPSGLDLGGQGDEVVTAQAVYQPDIIVLLTDGANSQGPRPLAAAQEAADRQVRVYTIGFGTEDPIQMVCTQEQLGSDAFGGFGNGFGGGGFGRGFDEPRGDFRRFLVIDESTLQAVADMTGGSYYRAENADQLHDVFVNLPTQIELQEETVEISVLFAAIGAILLFAAVTLSVLWNRFP